MASSSPILLLPLFKGLQVSTNGTAQSKSYMDIYLPQLRNLLPQASGLFLVGLTENSQAGDFEWMVQFISGFDRVHEASPIDISNTPLDAASAMRTAEYTTTANFLLESRLRLWWQNHAGVSGIKSAQLSAVLGVHLITA